MSKGPVMAWHPETGESQVYADQLEVPADYLPHHPKDADKVAAAAKKPTPDCDMTKKEILAALDAGGIKCDPRANVATLHAQLTEAVKKALTDGEVAFDENLPTKQLMELLPPAE